MLNQLTASDFDTLFLPGGHGPMWDLSADIDIKQLVKIVTPIIKLLVLFVMVLQGSCRQ